MNAQTHQITDPQQLEVVEALNARLGELIGSYLRVKQAHWNLRGPWFFARHELLDTVATHLSGFSDDVAERIGTLGAAAHGLPHHLNAIDTLPTFEVEGLASDLDYLDQVVATLVTLSGNLGETIALEATDVVTEDLLTEVKRTVEKDIWFLRSNLERS